MMTTGHLVGILTVVCSFTSTKFYAQDTYIQPGVSLQLPVGAYSEILNPGVGPSVGLQYALTRHWGGRFDVSSAGFTGKDGYDGLWAINICGGMDYFFDRRPKGVYTGFLLGYIGTFGFREGDPGNESKFPDAKVTPMLSVGHLGEKLDMSTRGGLYLSSITEEPSMWYIGLVVQYRIHTEW